MYSTAGFTDRSLPYFWCSIYPPSPSSFSFALLLPLPPHVLHSVLPLTTSRYYYYFPPHSLPWPSTTTYIPLLLVYYSQVFSSANAFSLTSTTILTSTTTTYLLYTVYSTIHITSTSVGAFFVSSLGIFPETGWLTQWTKISLKN